jgi:hypothetical protein
VGLMYGEMEGDPIGGFGDGEVGMLVGAVLERQVV